MIKSAYIHIPFCETICSYCDFCKYYYRKEWVEEYLEALQEEIEENYQGEILDTLYVGGGTPSVLSLEELKTLLEILSSFSLSKEVEYTFECNIENITEEKIKLLATFGVNRISIGIQTFQEKHLSFLNRKHTKEEAISKIRMIKRYIPNINMDLIYAIPEETMEELEDDLTTYLSLEIPHLSTYSLIIEEHTKLSLQKVEPISEELDREMYEKIEEKLGSYHHYELSNFSLPGYESRHNLTYWNNEEYYGFGLGASGYVGKTRYTNTRSLKDYVEGKRRRESHLLSKKERMEEEFMLGLRKVEGISLSKFQKKFHCSAISFPEVQSLLKRGLLKQEGDTLLIPSCYLYISNTILVELIDLEG